MSAVALSSNSKRLTLAVVYLPPRSTPEVTQRMVLRLNRLVARAESLVLCGDFNMPKICWDTKSGPSAYVGKSSEEIFLEFCSDAGLCQYVREPTFISSANILDLVFSNDDDSVVFVAVTDLVVKSDHWPVEFSLRISADTPPDHAVLLFNKANFDAINANLARTNWYTFFGSTSGINEMYDLFIGYLHVLISLFVPSKIISQSFTPNRRATGAVRRLLKVKLQLWKLWKAGRVPYRVYEKADRKFRKASTWLRRREERRIMDMSPKQFFSYSKMRMGHRNSDIPTLLKTTDNSRVTTDEGKALALRDYFSSVFKAPTATTLLPIRPDPDAPSLASVIFTEERVFRLLSQLKHFLGQRSLSLRAGNRS